MMYDTVTVQLDLDLSVRCDPPRVEGLSTSGKVEVRVCKL